MIHRLAQPNIKICACPNRVFRQRAKVGLQNEHLHKNKPVSPPRGFSASPNATFAPQIKDAKTSPDFVYGDAAKAVIAKNRRSFLQARVATRRTADRQERQRGRTIPNFMCADRCISLKWQRQRQKKTGFPRKSARRTSLRNRACGKIARNARMSKYAVHCGGGSA